MERLSGFVHIAETAVYLIDWCGDRLMCKSHVLILWLYCVLCRSRNGNGWTPNLCLVVDRIGVVRVSIVYHHTVVRSRSCCGSWLVIDNPRVV